MLRLELVPRLLFLAYSVDTQTVGRCWFSGHCHNDYNNTLLIAVELKYTLLFQ